MALEVLAFHDAAFRASACAEGDEAGAYLLGAEWWVQMRRSSAVAPEDTTPESMRFLMRCRSAVIPKGS